MELRNQFSVPVPIDEAWTTLLDVERIAPCMPGAVVESFDGQVCRGRVKLKVGPIQLTYGGELTVLERDEARRVLVMSGQGKETKGNSRASARVTATLTESAGTTTVDVLTDLELTGKPAQFGRGIIGDVSNRLVGTFAGNLQALIAKPEPAGTDLANGGAQRSASVEPQSAEPPPLDAASLLPPPIRTGFKFGAVGLVPFLLGWWWGARRR